MLAVKETRRNLNTFRMHERSGRSKNDSDRGLTAAHVVLTGPGNSLASFCGTISLPSEAGPNNSAITSSKATSNSSRGSAASRNTGSPFRCSRTYLRHLRLGTEGSSPPNSSSKEKAFFVCVFVIGHRIVLEVRPRPVAQRVFRH